MTFKIRRMRMRIEELILSVRMQCTSLGHFNNCNTMLFPNVNKNGVHISKV